MKRFLRIFSALLLLPILAASSSCGAKINPRDDLTQGYQKENTVTVESTELQRRKTILTDYGWSLFSELLDKRENDGNLLFSPLSLEFAFCMVANGACGETKTEIETAIGLSVDEINEAMASILEEIENCKFGRVALANSVWFRDESGRLTVNPAFLQATVDFYDSQIYAEPFDASTVQKLNAWVKKYSDGMIPNLIDRIDDDTVMLLCNVLAFEGTWETPYEADQIAEDRIFTEYSGETAEVTMLSGEESFFVEGNGFTGFTKRYKGDYEMLFLLPDEGADLFTTLSDLSGEDFLALIENGTRDYTVITEIPEFAFDCTYEDTLIPAMKETGISLIFDKDTADLSTLGKSAGGNLYVGMILQKTHIELMRKGTKAAAATIIGVKNEAAPGFIEKPVRYVLLDRPFAFVILDAASHLPLFVGALTEIPAP